MRSGSHWLVYPLGAMDLSLPALRILNFSTDEECISFGTGLGE